MKARMLAAAGGELEVAGLALAERARRALARAGIAIQGDGDAGEPLLLVAGDALVEPSVLEALARAAAPAVAALAVAGCERDPALLRVPHGTPIPPDADGLGPLAERFRARGLLRCVVPEGGRCERVRDAQAARAAGRALRAALVRESDGFFARHLDRKLSGPLSVWLVRRGVGPNTITAVATLVGLAGAAGLASPGRAWQTLGALLFVASTVLDGCDGEVARLSLRETRLGHALDLACDNLVNAAVFVGLGAACLRADTTGRLGSVVAVGLLGLGFATAMGFRYSRWLERSGRLKSLRASYERLASRDFAYLLLVLAAAGRLVWFVWAAAAGSWAFGLLLGALRLAGWPAATARGRVGPASLGEIVSRARVGPARAAAPVTPGEEVAS
jgi:phosphatidylglycerophosphate synthase